MFLFFDYLFITIIIIIIVTLKQIMNDDSWPDWIANASFRVKLSSLGLLSSLVLT
jgi:hypothetical protein